MHNEVSVNFIDERCPQCKAMLLTDWTHKWCSFAEGTVNYPACDYGRAEKVLFHDPKDN
ncbi:hypothetical protein GSbR_41660 [Geobacter sp. SVR]|uniref:hypothetical protein n=1 Tax=Geobacter sp. SVR TaxID=2495594 RepID=UPI00143F00C1|nr:hypothetical protein [Geobacter sp. SVR]BCS54083.1 hypothetical protein GSVR_23910 [Geobacter sp. SVR]GCF87566.1 hypothetical protein GSbR_41660 [Geobacter sp. SVR]